MIGNFDAIMIKRVGDKIKVFMDIGCLDVRWVEVLCLSSEDDFTIATKQNIEEKINKESSLK